MVRLPLVDHQYQSLAIFQEIRWRRIQFEERKKEKKKKKIRHLLKYGMHQRVQE